MISNTCSYCNKEVVCPRGIKYISQQGKPSFYCTRRCYVFVHETRLTKKKLAHLSTLRIKKNKSKVINKN